MGTYQLLARVYWCPKSTGVRSEWEDGFALSEGHGLLSIADGATWAAQSRRWARELTASYVNHCVAGHVIDPSTLPAWIDAIRAGFSERAGAAAPSSSADAWWSAEVEARGAAAAFVGMRMDLTTGRWSAVAVGDSCLFHFPAVGPSTSFPLDRPEQFTSSPVLISTAETPTPAHVLGTHGEFGPGDLFVLATDALSSWIVGELTAGRDPSMHLRAVRSSNFGTFIRCLRQEGLIPDDDVTLIRAKISEGSAL